MSTNANDSSMSNIVDAASSRLSSARDAASTSLGNATDKAKEIQSSYFRITDDVPEAFWYWAALASIITSALLFFVGERKWSTFVGQWPPTFLLFGLFHKLLGPGHDGEN